MITKINHIAIAVSNLEEAARFYTERLGLELGTVEHVPSNRVRVAFLPIGESRLELVQPDSPDSPVARFIEKRGAGIQHLCLEVDDIDAELARLASLGVELINRTPVSGAHGYRVAFIHPRSAGGVLIELSQPPSTPV